MQKEGYAGANAIAGTVNNLWGWQVTDPASVRADQWQAVHNTYIRDRRKLGMNQFFESVHPSAQLQIVERMIEAIQRDYWKADSATRDELERRREALRGMVREADRMGAEVLAARGFGMMSPSGVAPTVMSGTALSSSGPPPPVMAPAQPSQPIGRVLVREQISALPKPETLRGQLPALVVLLALFLAGILQELRARRSFNSGNTRYACA